MPSTAQPLPSILPKTCAKSFRELAASLDATYSTCASCIRPIGIFQKCNHWLHKSGGQRLTRVCFRSLLDDCPLAGPESGVRVRPEHRMHGHTGFLITARRLAPGVTPPLRKRRPAKGAYGEDAAESPALTTRDWSPEDVGERPVSEKKIRKMRRAAGTVLRRDADETDETDETGDTLGATEGVPAPQEGDDA